MRRGKRCKWKKQCGFSDISANRVADGKGQITGTGNEADGGTEGQSCWLLSVICCDYLLLTSSDVWKLQRSQSCYLLFFEMSLDLFVKKNIKAVVNYIKENHDINHLSWGVSKGRFLGAIFWARLTGRSSLGRPPHCGGIVLRSLMWDP